MIPATVDELDAGFLCEALDREVTSVEVLDAHSGTTGRAVLRIRGSSDLPDTVFVKLEPFPEDQREVLRMLGLGVAEARLYAEVGSSLPVRVPKVWASRYDVDAGRFVVVLEDLAASGCRFPVPGTEDLLAIAWSTVEELAKLHAAHQGQDLAWLETPIPMQATPEMGAFRAAGIRSALEQFADDFPPAFRRIGELYASRTQEVLALFNAGDATLCHGDCHLLNLFVDGATTGFFDWAMSVRAPGVRDVAYNLCGGLPREVRRAEEGALLDRYLAVRAECGSPVDPDVALLQYRVYSVEAWASAAGTAALGSALQPIEVGMAGMARTTEAVEDLGAADLLDELLG